MVQYIDDHIIANCEYNNRVMTSVIKSGNTYGCQFHPERRGKKGLNILKNFAFTNKK